MEFERINPLTHEPASKAAAMSPADARAVADRAASEFPGWSTLGPNARRALLMNAAAALETRKDDFVRAMMAEVGATAGWGHFNVIWRRACCARLPR